MCRYTKTLSLNIIVIIAGIKIKGQRSRVLTPIIPDDLFTSQKMKANGSSMFMAEPTILALSGGGGGGCGGGGGGGGGG